MNFELTEEQVLLADTVERALLAAAGSRTGVDGEWDAIVALGLPGLLVDEAAGGAGLGAAETFLVMEALGHAGSRAPFLSRIVLPCAFLHALDPAAPLLGRIASGEATVVTGGLDPADAPLSCSDAGVRLFGTLLIPDGCEADTLLLIDREGARAFLLEMSSHGVATAEIERLDGGALTRVALNGASGELIAQGDPVIHAADAALMLGNAALCAEAAGIMRALVDKTSAYLVHRRQFGTNLSSFQVLQHRLVDMRLHQELSRSMAAGAAMAVDAGSASSPARVVAAAKIQLCLAGRRIAEEAIQLHGAIGMTDELDVGRYAKRLLVIEQTLGNRFHHLDRLMAESEICDAAKASERACR